MYSDGKTTFVYGIVDENERMIETQNIRAENVEAALNLLRRGGFLVGDRGEEYRGVLLSSGTN